MDAIDVLVEARRLGMSECIEDVKDWVHELEKNHIELDIMWDLFASRMKSAKNPVALGRWLMQHWKDELKKHHDQRLQTKAEAEDIRRKFIPGRTRCPQCSGRGFYAAGKEYTLCPCVKDMDLEVAYVQFGPRKYPDGTWYSEEEREFWRQQGEPLLPKGPGKEEEVVTSDMALDDVPF